MELTKRRELSTYLRWGDCTKIANLAKVSRKTVENWLNGTVKNSTVAPYVIAVAEQRKREIEELVKNQMSL